jgi:mono/diheme cytochrome c family protein
VSGGAALSRIAAPAAGILCVLALGYALRDAASPAALARADAIARGRYLSHGLLECFECHSPLKSNGLEEPEPSMLGAGDVTGEAQHHVAPNLTPDPETGIGRWTDEQLICAIREGIGHDGRRLALVMPYDYFSVMTDEDARAIVAYLRTLRPIRHELPKWTALDVDALPPEPLRPPARTEDLTTRVARGGYLVRMGRCPLCHTARPADGLWMRRRVDMELGGGRRFGEADYYEELSDDPAWLGSRPPPGAATHVGRVVTSPNITSDPSGIAYYDEKLFIRTIRSGKVAGVRELTRAMVWFEFRKLNDGDLGAIFAYLRSVPPVRHRVSNSDPPTWCPRCGRFHGLGELNEP